MIHKSIGSGCFTSLRRSQHCFLRLGIGIRVASIVEENTLPSEEEKGETVASTQDQLARKVQHQQSPGLSYAILGQGAMC